MSQFFDHFQKFGFGVAKASNLSALEHLRNEIFVKAKEVFEAPEGPDVKEFFDNFHCLNFTGTDLNARRVKLIQHCTQHTDSGTRIYEAFADTIEALIGPDILVQKNTNLVIQQPNDPNPSELHRDAPANSPFEVVVWLPLTDAYGTKAMYMLDLPKTEEALSLLERDAHNWKAFEDHCIANSETVAVPFGSALFFWTGLFHGSKINIESETRWTLNMRFKGLFSPNGLKEPFEFFKLFKMSPLTQLGMRFQKREMLP